MRIATGPLTDWELEFYTAPTAFEMGLSMRLVSPGGDVYFISCRDGRNIEIRHSTNVARPVNPTPTWTAEECDRAFSNVPSNWTTTTNSTARLQYSEPVPQYVGIMNPDTAREVFRQLENDLSTPSDEETSCL